MSEEFKTRLVEFAKTSLARADRAQSEEASKQYLILPFFQLLGYDPLNPDEVIPEAHASFSSKFRNKVDYAICIDGEPVIAVECKKTGTLKDANRGELKGYFNAVPSTKLGILTDGLAFEFYSDTMRENMMDDQPFVRLDLNHVVEDRISDQALDALQKLRKGTFDPADVGADAKLKLYISRYVTVLEEQFTTPSEEFVRTLMDVAKVDGRRTARLVEEHTPIVADAVQAFLDKKILERVGFANRQDLVKVSAAPPAAVPAAPETDESAPSENGVITTELELKIYEHVRTRLSFLVKDEELFRKVQELFHKDYKTVFAVCYKQERRGKLFNFREGPRGEYRFDFPESPETIETTDLTTLDKPLLESFMNRVAELG